VNVALKIVTSSMEDAEKSLSEIARIRADLVKKYPDIVVNVEVEIR